MNLENYLLKCQKNVNEKLDSVLPSCDEEPRELHKAMRYTVLNGGKRLRSAFIYATGEAMEADIATLDTCSAAVELIHAFSLIHDDLPAIDNDDIRRGKPSCHKAFGEATAILAGDALLALSLEVMTTLNKRLVSPDISLKMIRLLCHHIGSMGMAGGEALDADLKNHTVELKKLAFIYRLKTSYLLCASILLGALSANCRDRVVLKNLERFGLYIGLAFQIHDDILSIETDTEILGKPQGSDIINNKPTYPTLIGIKNSKLKEDHYLKRAIYCLEKTNLESEKLLTLGKYAIKRKF